MKLTWRWFVTRLELAVALVCITLPLVYFADIQMNPPMFGPMPDLTPVLAIIVTAELGMLVGLRWMVRIMRGEPDSTRWRFRDR